MKNSDSIDVTINPMMPAVGWRCLERRKCTICFNLKVEDPLGLNGYKKYIDG